MDKNSKKERINLILKVIAAALAICALLFTSGCSNSTSSSEVENMVPKAGTVQLYHATDTTIEPDEGTFQLMQPDNIAASVEEVLEKLQVSKKLYVERYMIDVKDSKKVVRLYIKETAEMTEEELLLNKAAIVKSIEGIGVDSVVIELGGTDGKVIETATYTDASFFDYEK